MKEISVTELKKMIDAKENFELIDVREQHEADVVNIGAKLIPMGEAIDRAAEFPKDKKVVVHCRSGKRSATVIQALEAEHGFDNLYNLKGGILAWVDEIDPTLSKY